MEINKKVILFGASLAGKRMAFLFLNTIEKEISFFVDNDKRKWGTTLLQREIYSPEYLKSIDKQNYIVIIASMYSDEISLQLNNLGFKMNENYYLMENVITYLLESYYNEEKNILQLKSKFKKAPAMESDNNKVIIVLPNGFVIGGLEIWSKNLFKQLLHDQKDCYILNLSPLNTNNFLKRNILSFEFDYSNYIQSLEDLMVLVNELSPVTIISNTSEEIMLACKLLNRTGISKDVNLIAVIHSDLLSSYEQYRRFERYTTKFICVSEEIQRKFRRILPHRDKDIVAKISPISIKKSHSRMYSVENQPIKLGYVARLIKKDKRSHDIIPFLEALERVKQKYELHIAGDGECFKLIDEYVKKNGLESKVVLYGQISNEEIYSFWETKDIFLNFSEREGTSISMLEALANGVVPVLTNVSGVAKFVDHGENGFIVEPKEIGKMVEYIKLLSDNKKLLPAFGQKSRGKVERNCSLEEYADYIWGCCEME
ncbi:MAG TPA: glycosyltransferase family 4 protein [Bacillales bacterium]|nr:glycosyltransferase family 4 protein [Bacillales bacterium]